MMRALEKGVVGKDVGDSISTHVAISSKKSLSLGVFILLMRTVALKGLVGMGLCIALRTRCFEGYSIGNSSSLSSYASSSVYSSIDKAWFVRISRAGVDHMLFTRSQNVCAKCSIITLSLVHINCFWRLTAVKEKIHLMVKCER